MCLSKRFQAQQPGFNPQVQQVPSAAAVQQYFQLLMAQNSQLLTYSQLAGNNQLVTNSNMSHSQPGSNDRPSTSKTKAYEQHRNLNQNFTPIHPYLGQQVNNQPG